MDGVPAARRRGGRWRPRQLLRRCSGFEEVRSGFEGSELRLAGLL